MIKSLSKNCCVRQKIVILVLFKARPEPNSLAIKVRTERRTGLKGHFLTMRVVFRQALNPRAIQGMPED